MYCANCGNKMKEDDRFCSECGFGVAENQGNEARIKYAGKVIKCPSCGEILDAFIPNCPSCGHELRGTESTDSMMNLAHEIKEIESSRTSGERSISDSFVEIFQGRQSTKTDVQKISLIKNYPIPNTKEDLLEFFILACSNVNPRLYDTSGGVSWMKPGGVQLELTEAWKSKMEQAYLKAQLLFIGDSRLLEINERYNSIEQKIEHERNKEHKIFAITMTIALAILVLVVSLPFVIMGLSESPDEKHLNQEYQRLECIVENVVEKMEEGDYKYALAYAKSIQIADAYFVGIEDSIYWEQQREYWIERVIEEAEANGIIIEKN